jgi:hypothetical protein
MIECLMEIAVMGRMDFPWPSSFMFGEFSILLLNMSVNHIKTVVVCVTMMVRKSVVIVKVVVKYFGKVF